jgi:DDE superfamily endonuclease/Tc5 transposase DNA-binding domain/CENP-B N-terminal DNA-binding domain
MPKKNKEKENWNDDLLKTRKNHQRIPLSEQLNVIEKLESGICQAEIVRSLGLSKSTVSRIFKNSDKLKTIKAAKTLTLKSKVSNSRAKYPEIDKLVYEWFVNIIHPSGRCKPLPLSRGIIQARARKIAELLGVIDFTASDGWFRGWRWRYEIGKSVRLHGEAGDVNLIEAEKKMDEIRTTLKEKGYSRENTFNMDESGLFYRCMPNRTYVVGGGDVRQLGKGTKAMKAKDRVTAVFCCNSTGTCKIPTLIIGTSKQPHCFRNGRCPLPYIDQKKAWMDKERYKHWWFNVFLPCIREFTTEKVALLMDSCSGHDKTITDPLGQVECVFFPPNTTSIYQPLDQGIIAVIKTRYKTRMLTQMVNAAENFDELQVEAEKLPNGRKGISYGLPAHVLDAANLLKFCWDELPAETISACWRRSRCLALSDTEPAQSIESLAQVNRQIHSEAIVEISSQLARKFFSVLFLFKKYLSR